MENFLTTWLRISQSVTVRYFAIAGLAYVLFYFILKNRFLYRKIQAKFPGWDKMRYDILHSFQTILIFTTMATLVFFQWREYTNFYPKIDDYGVGYYLLTFPLMFIIHDTYFYWMHRFMHLPKVFKKVHLVHHQSTNPTPWTSYSFHFLEAVLEACIIPLIAFILPVHSSALGLFLLFQFIYNVYGHLGFELYPRYFTKTWIGKWINTSVAHNMHHKYFKGNYGLYFLFWDRAMGTLREDYDQTFDRTTAPKADERVVS